MKEKFLVISYFDMILGPNILYSKSEDINNIYGFPDLSKILDFTEKDGSFLLSFRKFQTINMIFNISSKLARGGKYLLMISCVIRASYFKNELTDIFHYLESKAPILEEFTAELRALPNFDLILNENNTNPTKQKFKESCEKNKVDFFPIYDKYYDLLFPDSEIRIITQDINLQKKILLFGPKSSGKDMFLKTIETLQFYNQGKLDIPTRILGILIDNIILSKAHDFLNNEIGLEDAQAIIFIIKNIDEPTCTEVNSLIEHFISSYSKEKFGTVPLIIINNVLKDRTPIREKEIKKNISTLKLLRKEKIPIKYYSFNVSKEDQKLFEPLKWLIKEIFT